MGPNSKMEEFTSELGDERVMLPVIFLLTIPRWFFYCSSLYLGYFNSPGPSCSKLTMLLVNDSLKFTWSDMQIC